MIPEQDNPLAASLRLLRCPCSGQALQIHDGTLQSVDGKYRYSTVAGTPDLRHAPGRLAFDQPWPEPIEMIRSLNVAFPPVTVTGALPEHLDRHLASIPPAQGDGAHILEIGCGERQCENWFVERGYRYIGIDVDIRGPGPNLLADAHNLPFQNESFDYCTSMAVMEHLVSPQMMSNEVYRVLKPGGIFFGSSAFVYGFHDTASYFHMSHAGLLRVLSASGFHVERMWPDWRYTDAIPSWAFRGAAGAPWRLSAKAALTLVESSYVLASNVMRTLFGKPKIDRLQRAIEIAGSVSFSARKPLGRDSA